MDCPRKKTAPSRGGGVPPQGYVCNACNIPGHWIQQCPKRLAAFRQRSEASKSEGGEAAAAWEDWMAPAAGRESGGGSAAGGKPAFARPKPKRKREDYPQEPAKVRRAAQPAKGQGQAQGKKAALERMRSLMQQAEGAAPAEKRRLLKECAATPPGIAQRTAED